jgi:hypothetical protein
MTTDDTATPFPPRILVKSTVAKDAETTLTMVFPREKVLALLNPADLYSELLGSGNINQ